MNQVDTLRIEVAEEYCPKNHACPAVSFCPYGAIIQNDIFSAPYIDEKLCKNCGKCTRVCSVFQFIR